ncbi:uncharacterized protein LOC143251969 isoform X2 [Tachypleus tridentatus]
MTSCLYGESLPEKTIEKKNPEALFSEFWTWRLQQSPEFASQTGNHTFDDRLYSYSLEAIRKRKTDAERFLHIAQELLPNVEDGPNRYNLELLISELQLFVDGMKFPGYLFPVNRLEGVQLKLKTTVNNYMNFDTAEDFRKLISRYRAFPKQADEIIELMKEGIRQGRTNHAVSMKHVLEQFALLQKPVEDSSFFKPFLSFPDSVPSTEQETLKSEAKNVIEEHLLPAFKKLGTFIEKEYMAATRPLIAVSSLPNGKEIYKQCLRLHTTTDKSPEEIHEIGLREVERISGEINELIKVLGKNSSRSDFFQSLRTDPTFYFESKEDLLNAYRNTVDNIIRPKLPLLFKNIPKTKLIVVPIPPERVGGSKAFYQRPSDGGSKPAKFLINAEALNTTPKYEMMTLSLHEGEPGHHLQVSYVLEQKALPDFRRNVEYNKLSDVPSHFPFYTAFIEGWALYSEHLGNELGLFKDPYFRLGHLSEEIFRACRLVVDTGIHALGWSRDKAINYMLENSASTRQNIENEIDRYITWPGQACAYKMGELKIRELRKKAEIKLGKKFDVKEFHDVILQNQGPLGLLDKQVEKYIQKSQETGHNSAGYLYKSSLPYFSVVFFVCAFTYRS